MKARTFPIHWPIAYLAAWYWLVETIFFGLNLAPQSPAEVIADGIAFLLFALALAFSPKKPRLTWSRLLNHEGQQIGLVLKFNNDIDVLNGEDVQP